MNEFSDEELLAFADELLEAERSQQIEAMIRDSDPLKHRIQELLSARDQGGISPGEVWRHHRLSCPTTTDLSLYRLQALDRAQIDYIQFHLETIGCVYCLAQLAEIDTEAEQVRNPEVPDTFRQSLYASSVGMMKPKKAEE